MRREEIGHRRSRWRKKYQHQIITLLVLLLTFAIVSIPSAHAEEHQKVRLDANDPAPTPSEETYISHNVHVSTIIGMCIQVPLVFVSMWFVFFSVRNLRRYARPNANGVKGSTGSSDDETRVNPTSNKSGVKPLSLPVGARQEFPATTSRGNKSVGPPTAGSILSGGISQIRKGPLSMFSSRPRSQNMSRGRVSRTGGGISRVTIRGVRVGIAPSEQSYLSSPIRNDQPQIEMSYLAPIPIRDPECESVRILLPDHPLDEADVEEEDEDDPEGIERTMVEAEKQMNPEAAAAAAKAAAKTVTAAGDKEANPVAILRKRLGFLLRFTFVGSTFLTLVVCVCIASLNFLPVEPVFAEDSDTWLDGKLTSSTYSIPCIAFAKMAGFSYVMCKFCAYMLLFTKARLVHIRPRNTDVNRRDKLHWIEKLALLATLAMPVFAAVVTYYIEGEANALDASCELWMPLELNVTMIAADVALSAAYLWLFLQPLRQLIQMNNLARSRYSTVAQSGSSSSTPPATESSANAPLERVMRTNASTCIFSITATVISMMFMIVAHIYDSPYLQKHIGTVGTSDLFFTCCCIAVLMRAGNSEKSKLTSSNKAKSKQTEEGSQLQHPSIQRSSLGAAPARSISGGGSHGGSGVRIPLVASTNHPSQGRSAVGPSVGQGSVLGRNSRLGESSILTAPQTLSRAMARKPGRFGVAPSPPVVRILGLPGSQPPSRPGSRPGSRPVSRPGSARGSPLGSPTFGPQQSSLGPGSGSGDRNLMSHVNLNASMSLANSVNLASMASSPVFSPLTSPVRQMSGVERPVALRASSLSTTSAPMPSSRSPAGSPTNQLFHSKPSGSPPASRRGSVTTPPVSNTSPNQTGSATTGISPKGSLAIPSVTTTSRFGGPGQMVPIGVSYAHAPPSARPQSTSNSGGSGSGGKNSSAPPPHSHGHHSAFKPPPIQTKRFNFPDLADLPLFSASAEVEASPYNGGSATGTALAPSTAGLSALMIEVPTSASPQPPSTQATPANATLMEQWSHQSSSTVSSPVAAGSEAVHAPVPSATSPSHSNSGTGSRFFLSTVSPESAVSTLSSGAASTDSFSTSTVLSGELIVNRRASLGSDVRAVVDPVSPTLSPAKRQRRQLAASVKGLPVVVKHSDDPIHRQRSIPTANSFTSGSMSSTGSANSSAASSNTPGFGSSLRSSNRSSGQSLYSRNVSPQPPSIHSQLFLTGGLPSKRLSE